MKRKLLLICVALLCAVGSWAAYTGVEPAAGRTYFLYNVGANAYFVGTSGSYGTDGNIANATPVTVESSNSNFKLAFVYGGTTYRIYHYKGTRGCNNTTGVEFWKTGNANGYKLVSNNGDKNRYMDNGGWFGDSSGSTNTTWQFISCDEVAETHYVTSANGWEKVSSVSALQTNPQDYFFAIFSANVPGLILDATTSNSETTDDKTKPYYKTAANPLSSSQYLFEIKTCGSGLALKSCSIDRYFANSSGNPWHYNATKSSVDDDCEISVTLSDGVYSIQTKHAEGVNNYLGLWWPENGYKTGQKLAGNKSIAEKGLFLIYRIAKKDLDMTSAIVNPSFETGNTDGWTFSTTGASDAAARSNGDGTYTMSGVDGSWLFNIWAQGNPISQTLANMPAGIYKLTAVMGTDKDQEFRLTMGGVTGTKTSSSEGKGTGVTVEAYYKLTTPGSLTISADAGGSCWYKVDNFHLTYMEPSLPGSLEPLTAPMKSTIKTAANDAITSYNTAISNYNSDQSSANLSTALTAYRSAEDAIADAEESEAIYSTISGIMTTYQGKAEALDAAGQAAYTSAINTASTGAKSKYNDGTYTTAAEAETAFSNTYIAAVKAQVTAGADMTDAIINPSFETGNTDGWTVGASSDTGVKENEGNYATTGTDGTHLFNTWWQGIPLSQTIGDIPNGKYRMTVSLAGSDDNADGKYFLLAEGNHSDVITITQGTKGTFNNYSYDFVVSDNSATIGVVGGNDDGSYNAEGHWWYKADNFRLTYVGVEKDVTVSAKAGKYGTVILPFTYDFSSDGDFADIKFYSCSTMKGDYVQISEVDEPAANTPYLIKNNGESDFSKDISGYSVAVNDSYTVGLLTGVYTAATIAASDGENYRYVLQTHDDGVQAFYKVDADFTATAYKCYLTVPVTPTPVKAFIIDIVDADGINTVQGSGFKVQDSEIYNLAGQRLSKAQKGVNIVNGKKVLVK